MLRRPNRIEVPKKEVWKKDKEEIKKKENLKGTSHVDIFCKVDVVMVKDVFSNMISNLTLPRVEETGVLAEIGVLEEKGRLGEK